MIPYTRPYLPSRERLEHYIDGIYQRQWLTNDGELTRQLTDRLEKHLGVENLLLVANGTLALQIAYRALGIAGGKQAEAITTPFSFVATASSLKWEGVEPIFSDIDSRTWCLDPHLIEKAITQNTCAIIPTHVFGNVCNIESIDDIGRRRGLKIIYDGAHAFGVTYKRESVLKYGDASILSFHATKLFHSIEGGAIIFRRRKDYEVARKLINFGITGPDTVECLGINAKMNEFQAAMGLSVLDEFEQNLEMRTRVWSRYYKALAGLCTVQTRNSDCSYNYSYFPILLGNSFEVVCLQRALNEQGVVTRRYFYPVLNSLDFLSSGSFSCPVAEDVSSRILCLPLYAELEKRVQNRIISTVLEYASKRELA